MTSWHLILALAVSSIGSGFQHGYNIAVLNTPQEIIKKWMMEKLGSTSQHAQSVAWSALVAIYCIGGAVGGFLISLLSNKLGRKGGLIVNDIIVIVGGTLFGLTKILATPGAYLMFISRFIIGINSGLNAGLAPVYISEVSPTNLRGAFGSLYQLNITIAIVIAQALGIKSALGTDILWPLVLAVPAIVGLLQLIGLIFCCESPKFILEKKGDEEKTKEVIQKLAGDKFEKQFEDLKRDIEDSKKLPDVTVKDMFHTKKLRRPLIIICVLMMAQQLSGINAVMFYSTEIFKMAHFEEKNAQYSSVAVGIINVLTTIASVFFVELFGRKVILLVAFGGMFFSLIALFICLYFVSHSAILGYASLVLVCLYVILFALGAGGIPWLLGPELFNTAARPLAISFAVPTNWLFAFIVGLLFPPLQVVIGPAVFVIFILCNAGAFFYIWIFVPETRNRTIDDITAEFA